MASDLPSPGSTGASPTEVGRGGRTQRLAMCLERARNGDRNAVDDMVHELNPLLWRVARSQGLPADQAADVVQTAWLQQLQRLHEIRSPQALAGWMVSVTRREAWHTNVRDRKHVGEGTDALDAIADERPDVPDLVVTQERHRALWGHFQRLSERCRTLLRIVAHVDRPDYTALAEALGMARGSIGPTRGRCLAKLREMLLADPTWNGP